MLAPAGHAAGTWPQTPLAYCAPQGGAWQAVALSSDASTAIVSVAPRGQAGHGVDAYRWTGRDWGLPSTLPQPADSDGNYGYAVAVSGDGSTAVVTDWNRGLYVFVRTGSTWAQQAEIQSTGGPYWGEHVSISSDGNTVVATAPDASAPEPTGFAAAVTRQGVTWGQPVTLVTGHEVNVRGGERRRCHDHRRLRRHHRPRVRAHQQRMDRQRDAVRGIG